MLWDVYGTVTEISRSSISSYRSYGRRNLCWDLLREMLETWQRSVRLILTDNDHSHYWHQISTNDIKCCFLFLRSSTYPCPNLLKGNKEPNNNAWFSKAARQKLQFPVSVCFIGSQATWIERLRMCNIFSSYFLFLDHVGCCSGSQQDFYPEVYLDTFWDCLLIASGYRPGKQKENI